jgi:hypothetical protein
MKTTIRTWLFVAGGAFVLLFLALPNHPEFLNLLGWIGLLSGYFLWLTQSYKRKATLYTRGGALTYEKQPALYKCVYLLMLLVGIFAVLVLFVINLMPGER